MNAESIIITVVLAVIICLWLAALSASRPQKTWALKFGTSDGRQMQRTAYEQAPTADAAIAAFRKRLPNDEFIIHSVQEVEL